MKRKMDAPLFFEDDAVHELAKKSDYATALGFGVCLLAVVQGMKPRTVLEYGTHLGYSACVMASRLQAWGGKVWTVDKEDQSEAISWATRFGFLPFIEFRHSITWEFKHEVDKYDLVFLDASHDYESWAKEWESIQSRIHKYSLIVVHDSWSSDWKRFEKEHLQEFQSILFPFSGATFLSRSRGEDFPTFEQWRKCADNREAVSP